MQTTIEEQKVIVRGSEEHKDYLRHRFGRIKEAVNGFETRVAVAGRTMLLIYVVYITVRAGSEQAMPKNPSPALQTGLLLLDIFMLALQVLGLEGSVPGLLHLADELDVQGKKSEARTVRRSSSVAQWLLVATAVDLVLQHTQNMAGVDITGVATAYTNILLILRVVVIGSYLVAMARLEHKGPRVISAHEAASQQEEQEQKQIRIDNANILATVENGISTWARPMVSAMKSGLEGQIQQILAQHATEKAVLKAEIEAVKMASGSTLYLAEIGRQFEALTQRVDAKIAASTLDADALTQQILRQICASENTSSVDVDALAQQILRQPDAKIDAVRVVPTPARQPAARQPHKNTPVGSTGDTNKIVPINGMTKAAFFAEFTTNPELLKLNSYKLAESFRDRNATEPTARRAKKEYLESHPEQKTLAV